MVEAPNSVCCICKESAAKISARVASEPAKPRISIALGRDGAAQSITFAAKTPLLSPLYPLHMSTIYPNKSRTHG
jgi:hypothetical protein